MDSVCVDLVLHPITAVIGTTSETDDSPEANIQEEDVLAYVQLMDDIDPITGEAIEKESFLTQLKKLEVIERKTAFFNPIGYMNQTDQGSGFG